MNTSSRVAVIGAGLIGSSIAWRLARSGARVDLFDQGSFGGEASSAGAGMLSPGGEFERPSTWFDLGVQGMAVYSAFVEELKSDTGLPIDFRICGCIHLAGDDEREVSKRRAEFQSAAGIRVEITSEGLYYPGDGVVDPTDLLRALRPACEARGVRIFEHRPVHEIEAGDYRAVVVAAGAWSGEIRVRRHNRELAIPATTPVKGHLLGFDLEPGSLPSMRRHGHTYVLQRSSGFTIAGSNEEHVGFDRTIDPRICEELHDRAARVFPAILHETPTRRWIGFRPRSTSGDGPQIGRVEGANVWLAYGHYRSGILLAPLTALRISGEIMKL